MMARCLLSAGCHSVITGDIYYGFVAHIHSKNDKACLTIANSFTFNVQFLELFLWLQGKELVGIQWILFPSENSVFSMMT